MVKEVSMDHNEATFSSDQDSWAHTMIEVKCSNCGARVGEKDGHGETGISHVLCCERCQDDYFKRLRG